MLNFKCPPIAYMNEHILYYLWLVDVFGVGAKRTNIVINHFGGAYEVYMANESSLRQTPGIKPSDVNLLIKNKNLDKAKKVLEYLIKHNIKAVCTEDDFFPNQLKYIERAPVMLFYIGDINVVNKNECVTIVGTRQSNEYGNHMAYEIAKQLAAQDVVVVSGMALGIDAKAHEGALSEKKPTVAFLACGVDVIYPYKNKHIYNDIVKYGGCVISEFFPKEKALKFNFPIRNRLMAGVSRGVVMVQARLKSGAMITVNHALEMGKDVFTVPAMATDPLAEASCSLLKDGAILVTGADEILNEYNIEKKNSPIGTKKAENKAELIQALTQKLTPDEQDIINILAKHPCDISVICESIGIDVSQASMILMSLELQQIVESSGGGIYKLINL